MTHTNRPLVRRGARLKAFTLLELVIAVVVIAALAIIAIPTFVNDISNAALARDTASLTAFAGDAQSIARSTNLDVPDVSAVNFALTEMPKLTGGASWSGVASAHAHVVGSSAYGTVSYDATDAVTSSIGYAMRSQNGGCVMALTTPSETVSWHYNYDLGVNCDGSHALGGPAETAPTYSVGVPGPSSSVLATLSGVDALVSWNPPTSGGTGIVSYEVTASLGDLTCTTAGTDCVVSGLSEGQTYTFSVVATNGVGPGDASPPSNALTVPEPPSTPSDVVVVSSNDGTVSVSWAPSSAGGIPVTYRASDAAGDACTTSSTTCVVSGLTVGTSYTFAVVATSAAGSSEPSAGVSVVPLTTPDAPTDVLATSSDGAATVIWDAPTNDGGTPITGYSVTDGAGHTCSTTGAHSCVVTGLANGTSYTFTVEAINAAGPGPASLPSRVVTPAGAPSAPTSLIATSSTGAATVSWSAPSSDGGSTITNYHVTDGTGDGCSTSGALTCTVTGLTGGTSYTFTATATNSAGTSSASSASNSVTLPATPGAPRSVVATPGSHYATISWSAPASDGGAPITGYSVTDGSGDTCTTSGATTCTISGLTNGTSYTFTVTATNAVGTSSASSASPSITPSTAPGAPTSVTVVRHDRSVAVSWSAPTSNGGSAISDYSVTDGTGDVCSSSSLTCTVTGLTNGTSYSFTVTATNVSGTGPSSTSSPSATPATVPDAPTTLIATSSSHAATLSWSAPNDEGAIITGYTASDGQGDSCTSDTTGCTVTGLTNGTSYTFTVTATNAVGTSSASDPSNTVSTPDTPGAPTSVIATPGSSNASVAWNAPSVNGGAPISGYSVVSFPGSHTCTTTSTTCTVSGLANGTSYSFTVVATNAVGDGPGATSNSVTPATVPGAPTSINVVAHSHAVDVSWAAPSNGGATISSYSVTDGSGDVCSSSTTTCTVTGLTNGTSYTFTVTATNSAGTSLPSASSASVTPASIPDAPTTVIATSSTGAVTVSWTAPSDGGSAITSYHVSDGQGDSCSTSGALTCTVTALTAGGTFTFTVTATNAVGISAASASSNSVTLPTVPGVPTSVIATPGSHYATVSWSAPSVTGGAPITNYVVTSSPGSFNCSSSSTTCTVTGLTNGVGYTFTVTATNAVGDSASSASSAPITPATAPDAPTGISVVAHNHAVTVSWSAPSNNGGSSISSYSVTDGSGDVCSSSALTCTVTGLTNGTSYTFTVAATNSAGTSLPSSASSAVTPATTPDAPLYAIATSSTGAATVSWTAPTSNGGATISGYSVTDGSGDTCSTSGALTCTVTGLSAGSTYSFTIAATNAVGTGVASAPSNSVTLPTVPGAPTGVIATPGSHYATVTWSAPSVTGGAPIIGYTVSDGVGDTCTTSGATACTVSGLTNGTSYTFTVRATNAVGDSAASAASIAVTPATVPGAPTSVTVVAHNQSVTVSWAAPSNGGASISSYSVTDGSGDVCSSSALSCTVSGLTNGTSYTFTVSATNSVGTGASSGSSASVTPITVPNAPTTVIATASINAVALSWNAPSNNGGAAVSSYSATDGSGDTCSTSGATSCTVSGLTPGTAYTFTVSAANAAGTGASSASSNSATTPNVPGAPTVVIATPGSTNATVSWTASPANGSTVTNYVVTSTPGNFTCSTTSTTCTVSGLANGTGYTFKVIATNAVGNSAASAASSSVTPATTPGAPTGVIGTRGNASVAVVFSAPSSNGGATISSYTVTSSPSSLYCTATSPSVGCTVSGLTNGTAYTFTVVATNSAGPSSPSLPSASVTPATTPSAPSELSAAAAVGSATVTFTGSAPNGSTITSYTVTSSPGSLTCNATVPATGCSISGLTPGVSYSFTAIATNALGNSLPSAPSNSVTIPTVPSAPSITVVTPGSTNVTISWTTPSNGGSAITGYTLYGNPSGTCTTSGATSCTVSGLTNGTSYTFTVTATNAVGTSSVSSSSAPTVPAAVPNAPTGLSASGANGTNIIPEVWSAPANGGAAITDYKLRYSTDNATWTTTDTGSTTLGYSQTVPSTVTYYVQVAAVNVMGQGAWSASDVVYWSNTGSYQYFNGTYTYSCLTGGTLSGTTCNIAEVYYAATQNANSGWTCPSGWGPATGSSSCSRTTGGTRANCLSNGGSWNANTSVCTLFTSGSYGPNGPDFGYYYTCLSGGSLSGSICITVYPSSYGATATPNYSTGYYYAFRG